jgi:hypothetical protein
LLLRSSTQIVTPFASATALTRLRPSTQLAIASLSLMPRRLPKNVITFGTFMAAAFGIFSSKFLTIASWLAFTLRPLAIEPPPA